MCAGNATSAQGKEKGPIPPTLLLLLLTVLGCGKCVIISPGDACDVIVVVAAESIVMLVIVILWNECDGL
jgi:hypothetical protein